jgi:glycerate dehydrogenase
MEIVVFDGYAVNPGDLNWEGLKKFGNYTIYDRTKPEEVIERAKNADAILTNKVFITDKTIEALPKLKYIGILSTGYNTVDIQAARKRNIIVTNIPAYSTNSVAQMVFAHILNITQRVAHYNKEVRGGKWTKSDDFCFVDTPLIELTGLKIGIIGYGNIGQAVTRIAWGFGMKVCTYSHKSWLQLPRDVEQLSLDELYAQSDIITLHCPLDDKNRGMINAQSLKKMKHSAILINTGRGGLINEQDLADALNSDVITAAGLDVLSTEPPMADNPLLTAKNCYITPHISWATKEARNRLINTIMENLRQFTGGDKVKNNVAK